jgi:hypothetical protein
MAIMPESKNRGRRGQGGETTVETSRTSRRLSLNLKAGPLETGISFLVAMMVGTVANEIYFTFTEILLLYLGNAFFFLPFLFLVTLNTPNLRS